ncbi:MAG TPA: NADH-quinone oxidoreductase subunit J [Candidatus Marinimicrobia bacterium]|jgi:NADH-quinone oxidoreductase subunit J|nr:NADH-quinone oxidoreductase subunit J [Candidatus Neomarinimicrobiota bacterium]HIO74513.1 NADH-quinone oxidoreductase subunit J [Candidatus Neomarinimicrobiota bacterium]
MLSFLFYFAAAIAVGTAFSVVLSRNAVYSAILLVVCFFSLALIYLLLEAYFLAVLEIFIYAGAIMVLFLFVIMLLNLGVEKAQEHFRHLQRGLSLFLVIVFFLGVSLIFLNDSGVLHQPHGTFVAGGVKVLGEALFTKYLLPFEIASLLLLVALIGTVYLAKRKVS